MQLYFVRHGQSSNNLLWEQTGSNDGRSEDPPLTEAGQQQAQFVAQFLKSNGAQPESKAADPQNRHGFGITHVYCSLMVRAVATGDAIAQALRLSLIAWPDLHEGGGIYLDDPVTGEPKGLPGKGRSYFERHHPNLILPESLDDRGWWNRPAETAAERMPRAQRWLSSLLERHGNSRDRVVVVSHGLFYNYVMASILKLAGPDGGTPWFALNNTAITRIDFQHPGQAGIMYTNRADFLPRELLTE